MFFSSNECTSVFDVFGIFDKNSIHERFRKSTSFEIGEIVVFEAQSYRGAILSAFPKIWAELLLACCGIPG